MLEQLQLLYQKVKLLFKVVVNDGIMLNSCLAAQPSCNDLSLWLVVDHPKLILTEEESDKKVFFEADELTDKY